MACRKIIINQDHSWSQEWQMIELWPKLAIHLIPKIIGHTWYVGDGSAGSTALLQSCVYICILINMNCFGPGSTRGFSGTFRSQFWHWFCTNRLWHSQTLQKNWLITFCLCIFWIFDREPSLYITSAKELGGRGQKNGNFCWRSILFMLKWGSWVRKIQKSADVI